MKSVWFECLNSMPPLNAWLWFECLNSKPHLFKNTHPALRKQACKEERFSPVLLPWSSLQGILKKPGGIIQHDLCNCIQKWYSPMRPAPQSSLDLDQAGSVIIKHWVHGDYDVQGTRATLSPRELTSSHYFCPPKCSQRKSCRVRLMSFSFNSRCCQICDLTINLIRLFLSWSFYQAAAWHKHCWVVLGAQKDVFGMQFDEILVWNWLKLRRHFLSLRPPSSPGSRNANLLRT